MLSAQEHRAAMARKSKSLKRNPDDAQAREELDALRAEYAATKLGDYIVKVVEAMPPLTDQQRVRLAALLLQGAA